MPQDRQSKNIEIDSQARTQLARKSQAEKKTGTSSPPKQNASLPEKELNLKALQAWENEECREFSSSPCYMHEFKDW